ncbi:hypothetical protein IGI67_003833 [Enterococcus sp. AZ196]
MIKNYHAFFKFSVILTLFFFTIASFQNNSFLEFAKGLSVGLLIVSAFFKNRNERMDSNTN